MTTSAAVLVEHASIALNNNVRRCARKIKHASITWNENFSGTKLGTKCLCAVRRSAGYVESKMYLSRLNIYLSSLSLTLKQFSAHRISVNRLPVPFTMLERRLGSPFCIRIDLISTPARRTMIESLYARLSLKKGPES